MKILGIDPGIERVGFGLIGCNAQRQYHALDWGVIKTSKNDAEAARLTGIYEALTALVEEVKPDYAAVEKLFFFKNAKTIIPVAQARGVIVMVLHQQGVPYLEYTPMQVKLNVTGYGRSEKAEVQESMKSLLGMDEIPKPDDAADALAMALSCAFEHGQSNILLSR